MPLVFAAVLTGAILVDFGRETHAQVVWDVDNLSSIGGHATTVVGDPSVVDTPFGDGIHFDGNDGLIVNANPLAGAATLTMEMLFRPDPIIMAGSNQPRIFHVQSSPTPPDHRAILEGRITDDNQNWYPDVFLQTQATVPGSPNNLALIDATKLRPLGRWYHYAMTYDGAELKAYIDGELVLSGNVALQPIADGRTSLGMRINQVNFFEGVIAKVRFTPSVLDVADFLSARLPGDYDNSSSVDAADYDTWIAEFGAMATPAGSGADGNGDGLVDAADYTVWRDHLPSGAAASSGQSVPEPAAIAMFAAGLLATPLITRRSTRSTTTPGSSRPIFGGSTDAGDRIPE